MAHILIFGDSITYGAWDKEGGWVLKLKKFIHQRNLSNPNKENDLLYNLGVSGDTTEDLISRFEPETKKRLSKEGETIIIFDIGINDSQFIHSKNGLRYQPQEFRNNLQKLFDLAQKFSSKIIFIGQTPVDETKTTPIPWNKDKSYKNEYIRLFNKALKNFCEQKDIPLIELFDNFMKSDYQDLLKDGLHPNVKGHQKIFKTVKDYLTKNKII